MSRYHGGMGCVDQDHFQRLQQIFWHYLQPVLHVREVLVHTQMCTQPDATDLQLTELEIAESETVGGPRVKGSDVCNHQRETRCG